MSIILDTSGPVSYKTVENVVIKEAHYEFPNSCHGSGYHYVPKAPSSTTQSHIPYIFQDVSPFKKVNTLPLWKDVKKHRLIKMTPHEIKTLEKRSVLVKVPKVTGYGWLWPMHAGSSSCPPVLGPLTEYFCKYDDIYDFKRAVDVYKDFRALPAFDPSNVSLDEQDVRSAVVSSANSGFDVLTTFAEMPETIELILSALKAARHPLIGMKEVWKEYKRRDPKQRGLKFHADLMNQWMQYRYGIMPLVMSIEDAVKLLNSTVTEFSTAREGDLTHDIESSYPLIQPKSFLYQKSYLDVKIRAVAKSKYDNANTFLIDMLTFNPLQTAWELIPLSFVVDWFVNVGDMLFNMTSSVGDLAIQRAFCSSIKYKYSVDTYLFHKEVVRFARSEVAELDYLKKPLRPSFSVEYKHQIDVDQRIFSESYSGYRRVLFNPSDAATLHFNPNLNWKRMIDGYVLSFKAVTKLLKEIKS